MNPANPLQYKFDGQWYNLEEKTIRLKIKACHRREDRRYWSKYGATMKNKQGFFAIRLGANMKIGVLDPNGTRWTRPVTFRNSVRPYRQTGTEYVQHHVCRPVRYHFYISNALMPVRDASPVYNWKRTLPNTIETLWAQFRPENTTAIREPQSGFLFNTNHSPFLLHRQPIT